jgi:Fur family transcriptional regulator, ferric uptake regulator
LMIDYKNLSSLFMDNGYKLTNQRHAVLNVIAENKSLHLSVEDIFQALNNKNPEIGLATVYRTIQLLEKLRLVNSINLDDGFIRYQFADPEERHQHHHLICEKCGNLADVQEDLLEELERQMMIKMKFKVRNHSLKLYGLCEKCMNNS